MGRGGGRPLAGAAGTGWEGRGRSEGRGWKGGSGCWGRKSLAVRQAGKTCESVRTAGYLLGAQRARPSPSPETLSTSHLLPKLVCPRTWRVKDAGNALLLRGGHLSFRTFGKKDDIHPFLPGPRRDGVRPVLGEDIRHPRGGLLTRSVRGSLCTSECGGWAALPGQNGKLPHYD